MTNVHLRLSPSRHMAPMLLWLLSGTAAAGSPSVALQMVKTLGLGQNFAALATSAASSSQTYRMIEVAVTPSKAKALLTEHLQRTLPKYQAQWDQNLALSYSEVLTDQAMTSISKDGRASSYAGKLMAAGREVGARMQARSNDLLIKATTEALTGAFTASIR